MKKLAVVILAAGEGTRMKSSVPKVLHKLGGKPIIKWVLYSVRSLSPEIIYVVVGHGSEKVTEALSGENIKFVEQTKQLGSGHALRQAEKALKNFRGNVLVLSGDVPLVHSETLKALVNIHNHENNSATVLSAIFDNPHSYGRICRSETGQVTSIVEEKDASEYVRKIKEINSGIYCFSSPLIWEVLKDIKPENVKKEYYLTDAILILNNLGKKVGSSPNAKKEEMLGVNTRADLAVAELLAKKKIMQHHMLNGVTIVDPQNTYINLEVKIGQDTTIHPGSIIEGKTVIGKNCQIGPFSVIKDTEIHDGTSIINSHVYSSKIESNCKIGPFSHIRPESHIKEGAKVGNFSETKKSVIGIGSKVNHLSYIGDSILGRDVNVGAGTITCNYDGVRKNVTVIGDNSFVGSNVNFVAPIKIGKKTVIGAGSTLTEDVPDGALAIARARQINKPRKK
jgi:bifunctional UDP-N-acetylglucosamine pyrophosphorylase/glucosamine-1-phosphate N-acetyltransferase